MNFVEDNFGFWNDSHEQNIINLTRHILNSQNITKLLFLTQDVCISIIPSRSGYFLIDSYSQNSSGKVDPNRSSIVMRFQNVVYLSKYIIYTYYSLDSSVQYEIQKLLLENNGIQEEEKRRVVSAHKSEYQQAVILDIQNKRKRERQAQENSKGTYSKKRKLSFLSCLKSFQNTRGQGPYYICAICNRTYYNKSFRIFRSNENDLTKYLATNVLSYDNKKDICMT